MITDAINAFGGAGRQVNGIRGVWNGPGPLADNLNSFNRAVGGGMSPEDAVWETFTGKFARRNGFTEASIDWDSAAGGLGNHTEFVVNFMRPGV